MTNINGSETGKEDSHLQYSPADIKAIRELKGLTLRDVCEVTKIGMNHLQVIENGDFRLLPPPVYSKSFIKKYAEAVGIESSVLLTRYEEYLKAKNIEPLEYINPPQKRLYKIKWICAMAGICLAVIMGAIYMIPSMSPQKNADENKLTAIESPMPVQPPILANVPDSTITDQKDKSEPAQETLNDKKDSIEAKTDEAASPTKVQNINTPTPKSEPDSTVEKLNMAGKPYVLTIQATELTWLKITRDHERSYEVLLKPGERIERRATEGFSISCGNAGGVDITFQGKSLGPLGKSGQVVHLTLP